MNNPLANLDKYEVLLASNSPRRKQLLAELGVRFESCALPDVDESYSDDIPTTDVAVVISQIKARAYKCLITGNQLVITADTVVVCNGKVMGKPTDANAAKDMLRELSGKAHEVVTGVTITTKDRELSISAVSEVEFAELNSDEIDYYVDKYKPMDKAGAYGIQEWIGCIGVKRISGSFYNVMGLPLQKLYAELKKL